MEHKVKVVPADMMVEHIQELLKETDNVPLIISGNSMSPFLVHGRDTVYLSRIENTLKRGDMVLYRRENGAYILHRIYKVNEMGCDMIGDAHSIVEPNIGFDNILAIVTAVKRKGKFLRHGSFWWLFFEKVWIRMIRIRPFCVKFYTKLADKT